MRYLLDTNVCIAFLNGRDPRVKAKLLAQDPAAVRLCSVVKAELFFGARNSAHVERNLARVSEFCAPFESVPFDDAAAHQYGVVRTQLRRLGTPIGANDLMIAAIALAHDLTLATRNQDEFQRVAGLRIDSW